jgi:uncharacterized membrane protein YagU involved in acid resistance
MTSHASKADLCKAMTAGALAGLAASFVMTRFHVGLSGRGVTGSENPQSNKPVDASGDDAAMETADLVAQSTTGQPLTRHAKTEVGGPAAHYAFGAAAGAVYGALRETMPHSPVVEGGNYGATLWTVADQLALPLVGLSPWPLKAYPATTNLQHLMSHIVYGLTMAYTYGPIRRAM